MFRLKRIATEEGTKALAGVSALLPRAAPDTMQQLQTEDMRAGVGGRFAWDAWGIEVRTQALAWLESEIAPPYFKLRRSTNKTDNNVPSIILHKS